jgi:hypothetical protein
MSKYKNYPVSGRYRFHGAYKDYHKLWDDFFEGKTSTQPPPFWEFVEEWQQQFRPFNRLRKGLSRLWGG